MKSLMVKIVLSVLSCIGFLERANAVTYYLSPVGSDTNPGTITRPWKTLQKAFNTVKGGDVVLFRAGTYASARARNLHPPAGSWITFKPYLSEKVRINTAGGSLRFSGASYIIIEGLEITNLSYNYSLIFPCDLVNSTSCQDRAKSMGNGTNGLVLEGTYFGNSTTDTHHIIVRNNNIHHNTGHGITSGGYDPIKFPNSIGNRDIQILNNHVHRNGYAGFKQGYGTYMSGRRITLRGNNFHHNSGNNIRVGNISANTHAIDFVIENNIISYAQAPFMHEAGVKTIALGAALYGMEGSIFRNNIVNGILGQGVWSVNINSAKPTLIYNNTVTGSNQEGIVLSGKSIARNNIIYANAKRIKSYELVVRGTSLAEKNLLGGNTLLAAVANSGIERNNLKGLNPLFVSPSTANFHIQKTSPAINKGLTLPEVTRDIDGQTRLSGTYDIGADEVK